MSVDVVHQVRARYPAGAITLEQCVKICNEVAWLLNGRSGAGPWGLRAKPDGTQWGGYSKDVIVHRVTGVLVDILVNAPAAAEPAWQEVGVNASYYAPVRLEWLTNDLTPPPPPPPPPDGLDERVAALEARLRRAGAILMGD